MPRGGFLPFLLAVCAIFWANTVSAQTVDVDNAVLNIPEGVFFNTGGGISLHHEGTIDNDGTIDLKGDWRNDGNGLAEGSTGTVVFSGENQQIKGTGTTEFHNLSLTGLGAKELATDVAVSGRLEISNCLVFTHDFVLIVQDPSLHNLRIENGGILNEKVCLASTGELELSSELPFSKPITNLFAATSAAPASPTTRRNSKQAAGESNTSIPTSQACSLQPGLETLNPNHERETASTGALSARMTMYFASGIDGDDTANMSFESNINARRGSLVLNLATASSLFGIRCIESFSA